MVVALIIISIFFTLSLFANIFLIKINYGIIKEIIETDQLEEELAFSQGEMDIPKNKIAQKFTNAIILYYVEKNPLNKDTLKIVDISSYAKNNVIGLTYFVQPQFFEELKNAIDVDNIKDKVRQQVIDMVYADTDEEVDEQFIDEVIEQAYGKIMSEDYDIDEENGTMTRPPIPHCTVYHLKDGRWLWRQESY